jgi:transcriptional regulator with XRE-family HTH domain
MQPVFSAVFTLFHVEHLTFGDRVGQARRAYGEQLRPPRDFRQADLARLLDMSSQAVGQWERGGREPDLETIARVAAALGVRAAWLAFGEEPMRAPGQVPALPAPAIERSGKPVSPARTDMPHAKLDSMERERSEGEEEERRRAAAKKRRRA